MPVWGFFSYQVEAGERGRSRTGPTGARRRNFWSGQAFVLVQEHSTILYLRIGKCHWVAIFYFASWRDEWNARGHRWWVWLIYPIAVGVEKTRGEMVTGCESRRVSLGRFPVVGEGRGPACLRVGWSFVVGGLMWWSHTLFGCARTPVCVFVSTSGCVVWDFARENGVGSCPAVCVDGRVNSAGFGRCRVGVVYSRGESICGGFWVCVFQRGGLGL